MSHKEVTDVSFHAAIVICWQTCDNIDNISMLFWYRWSLSSFISTYTCNI